MLVIGVYVDYKTKPLLHIRYGNFQYFCLCPRLAISIPNALTYFPDAENSETPVSLKVHSWEQVKKGISRAVSDYLK